MSTYIYLFCRDLSPDILADGESGQHLRNLTHHNVNTQQPTTKEAHMTDPTTTTLPNLPAWYRVPFGMTIPKGTPHAYAFEGGVNIRLDGCVDDITVRPNSYYTYYTERPIAPPLPTEEGATIVASGDERSPHVLLTRESGRWVNRYGDTWRDDDIRAWAPVTIGETVVMP